MNVAQRIRRLLYTIPIVTHVSARFFRFTSFSGAEPRLV
jgi:hypothetical protein